MFVYGPGQHGLEYLLAVPPQNTQSLYRTNINNTESHHHQLVYLITNINECQIIINIKQQNLTAWLMIWHFLMERSLSSQYPVRSFVQTLIIAKKLTLTIEDEASMMDSPWVVRVIAALISRAEESPHSIEHGAG